MKFEISALSGGLIMPVFAPSETKSGEMRTDKKRRVLLVEDDFLVALDLEHALVDADFHVVGVATSAGEAVSLARINEPDIVVMDIHLLGARDGIDAAVEIFRELGIRSVFATAHKDERMLARAEPASPMGWIQKPYVPRDLVRFIEKAMAS
jgi:two-component system, response regulator PdtaR